MKKIKLLLVLMLTLALALGTFTSCDAIEDLGIKDFIDGIINPDETPDENPGETPDEPTKEELWAEQYETITIAEALTLCEQFVDSASTERYYIIATVKSVDDTAFGKLMISDATGEIMVYGTNSADGSLKYDKMGVELKAGDVVLLYGTLQNYKGTTKEVQNGWLIDYYTPEKQDEPTVSVKPGDTITIAQALEIAGQTGANDRYYITATVKSVTNAMYGAMILVDETGEISVYNSKNADGTVNYEDMEDKPYKGDVVTVYATLQNFNGTKEIKSAYITEFTHSAPDINPDDYTLSTIASARDAADGDTVKVEGVVARITYANGMIPAGFMLIDNTSSIYVYDGDLAARVAIGNTVTIVGTKDHWILESEQNGANKFDYKGCNQITDCVLVSNDNGNSDFNKTWMTETTVKDILDTPVNEDISTVVYKVTALVKEVPGSNFTNFYFFDLDGETGSYSYSQCSGNDFEWVRAFDGKICTVYLCALNAKSSASDCFWRLLPISIVDEGFTFDLADAPEFAIDYYALEQFRSLYNNDPAIELITSVSSELLGFENVALSYASSDENVVKFTTADNKTVMNCVNYGTATITITATHGENTATATVTVKYEAAMEYDFITVEEAILAEEDSTVVVKGIVGPSLVNRVGFYLMGENGLIAVITTAETLESLDIGNEVIIEGKRETFMNPTSENQRFGQTSIVDATILVNNEGNHAYNDDYFIVGKNASDLSSLPATEDHTTEVYVMTVVAEFKDMTYFTQLNVTDTDGNQLKLYMGNAGQYSWMSDYYGQEITVEVAPCNWNDKEYYVGCILAIVLEDGTKIYNTSNFS